MNVDLFQGVESALTIKVVVMPVGVVPEEKFVSYFNEIQRELSVVQLANLTFQDSRWLVYYSRTCTCVLV